MTKLRLLLATALLAIGGLSAAYGFTGSLGGSIFPLTYITQSPINLTDGFNQMLGMVNAQTAAGTNGVLNIGQAGAIVPFNTVISSNPLVEGTFENFAVASVNAAGGATVLSGVTGRTLYPSGTLSVEVTGGNASAATSVKIVCLPSGTLVATFPIAGLISAVPVSPFSSTGAIAAGPAITQGCSSGDSIAASTVGTALATSTNFLINMPYVVQ